MKAASIKRSIKQSKKSIVARESTISTSSVAPRISIIADKTAELVEYYAPELVGDVDDEDHKQLQGWALQKRIFQTNRPEWYAAVDVVRGHEHFEFVPRIEAVVASHQCDACFGGVAGSLWEWGWYLRRRLGASSRCSPWCSPTSSTARAAWPMSRTRYVAIIVTSELPSHSVTYTVLRK